MPAAGNITVDSDRGIPALLDALTKADPPGGGLRVDTPEEDPRRKL